jgi:pimeloyl-ACP methyl ester carboxylesterase
MLTLDANEQRVIQAQAAERNLLAHYRLEPVENYVLLPSYGIRVRVLVFGAGEPLVIVPGNTGDGFPLIPLIARLPNRRTILINRPGGGLSEGIDHNEVDLRDLATATISTVMDNFELERAPLLAHSMGGHWSLWFASDNPERVSSLSLLGVPGNVMGTCPPFALRITSVRGLNRLLFRLITPRSQEKALRGLSFMGHAQDVLNGLPPAMGECYHRFQKLPHYGIASLSLMEATNRLRGARARYSISSEDLKKVRQPVLMIWGSNDPFGSAEEGRAIASTLPHAEFHLIDEAGHLPWLDATEECALLLL